MFGNYYYLVQLLKKNMKRLLLLGRNVHMRKITNAKKKNNTKQKRKNI